MVLSLLMALAAAGTALPLAAQDAPTTGADGTLRLHITLRVYNFPRLPHPWLVKAEETATQIFHDAGVGVTWVDCPLSTPELPDYPECSLEMGYTDFAVRILTRSMAEKLTYPAGTLGFGMACSHDHTGCYADVFYHRVEELTERGSDVQEVSPHRILGHAIAHEVGHLLLGFNSHSLAGIMRATWDVSELQAMSQRCLLFTPQQARRLRAEVLTRIRRDQLVADYSGASAGAR